ncbi:baseplate J/gp47 family protein [Virgibacillus salexigens]|uniref:Uncharacterized protein n=1 Tax=Virgibacillus massiliensis TaxID=1462526 RepID=A0A024QHR7_9BACI|nr:baseplate J/gp47 family protein [Virgibacillus massiliensis]CDQ41802.1 hypothetical protein BN990_04179 [Virgibacillus massiliensis]
MLVKRSKEEIIKDALDVIVTNTPITNFNAGSIARSITESLSGEFESLYEFAEEVLNNGYLSRAIGTHLELMGEMFNYPRRTEIIINQDTGVEEEKLIDDDTYRIELSKQVSAAVSSNEEAVRLACLSIPGVQSIFGKEYTHGTGTFSFILTTLNGFDSETVKQNMESVLQQVKAFGVKPYVILPDEIYLEIELQLILKEGTRDSEGIRLNVKSELNNYFGNFSIDQDFIYNDFVQKVMNLDDNIVDFKVKYFYLNDTPALLTNHVISEEERIRPRLIEIL